MLVTGKIEEKGVVVGGRGQTCIYIPGAMTSFCFWYLSKHLPISVRLPVGMWEGKEVWQEEGR